MNLPAQLSPVLKGSLFEVRQSQRPKQRHLEALDANAGQRTGVYLLFTVTPLRASSCGDPGTQCPCPTAYSKPGARSRGQLLMWKMHRSPIPPACCRPCYLPRQRPGCHTVFPGREECARQQLPTPQHLGAPGWRERDPSKQPVRVCPRAARSLTGQESQGWPVHSASGVQEQTGAVAPAGHSRFSVTSTR